MLTDIVNSVLGNQMTPQQYAAQNQLVGLAGNNLVTDYNPLTGTVAVRFGSTGTSVPNSLGDWMAGATSLNTRKPRPAVPAARVFRAAKRALKTETPVTMTRLKANIKSAAASARDNGQTALYEEMSRMLVQVGHDEKILKAGYATYIDHNSIKAFMRRAPGIYLTNLENFARPIPAEPSQKIRAARKAACFNNIMILHEGATMIKTTAQIVREKDPIAFGVCNSRPDRLYFITDWIDEMCSLTLSKLLMSDKFEGSLASAEVDTAAVAAEVEERKRMIANTSASTWQDEHKKALELEKRVVQKAFQENSAINGAIRIGLRTFGL